MPAVVIPDGAPPEGAVRPKRIQAHLFMVAPDQRHVGRLHDLRQDCNAADAVVDHIAQDVQRICGGESDLLKHFLKAIQVPVNI